MLEQIQALLIDLKKSIEDLPSQLKVSTKQIVINVLSDLATSLGLIQAGELRVGNGKEPGHGFTGVRISYPPMSYNGELWYDVSVENDVLQTGRNASNGKIYAGQGVVILDSGGISILQGEDNENKIKFTKVTGETCGEIYGYVDSTANAIGIYSETITGVSNANLYIGTIDPIATAFAGGLQIVNGGTSVYGTSYIDISPYGVGAFAGTIDAVNFVRFTNSTNVSIASIDTLNLRIGIKTTAPQEVLHVNGGALIGGDSAGYVGTTGLTNVTVAVTGANAGSVVMGTGRANAGWHKIMSGTTPTYVPYWTDIS